MFHVGGQTDGRTDMTKLIVAFRSFAKISTKKKHTHNNPIRDYGFICLHLSYIVIHQPQLLLLLFLIVTIISTTVCFVP